MTAAAPRTRAELFAGAAYDPSAAPGGLLAWQRPTGVALLQRGGAGAVGLPGRNPAVGPGRVAWRDGDRLVVADPASLAPVAAYDAPSAGAFALSELWLAWRVRDAKGADRIWVRSPVPTARPRAVAGAAAPGELGRPALAGDLLLFHQAGPAGSRLVALDLATGRREVLRTEPGAMLSNPATDGRRLLYVHATGRTQELRIGPLRPRDPAQDTAVLAAPSPGQRDPEHEPGHARTRPQIPLPPLARPGVDDTLWTTALTTTHAYVTRLRTSRRAPRSSDILRVPVPRAG